MSIFLNKLAEIIDIIEETDPNVVGGVVNL